VVFHYQILNPQILNFMAIATAVQRGSFIYVYDEKNHVLTTIPARDGLHGYTSGTVSVKGGSFIFNYDERGHLISTTPTGR